jgi:hypothetical protein
MILNISPSLRILLPGAIKLEKNQKMGWIENARPGNQGGVGNTLEDLLGIKENNLPLANTSE